MKTEIKPKHPSFEETNECWVIFKEKLEKNGVLKSSNCSEFYKAYNEDTVEIEIIVKFFSESDPYFEYSYKIQNTTFEELKHESETKNSIINKFSYEVIMTEINHQIKSIKTYYTEKEVANYFILKSLGYGNHTFLSKRQKQDHDYSKQIGDLRLAVKLQDPGDNDYRSCELDVYYYDFDHEENKNFSYEEKFHFHEFSESFLKEKEDFVFRLCEMFKLDLKEEEETDSTELKNIEIREVELEG